jgi:hypothetical protein
MTTITIQVPKELVGDVATWKRENWLTTLWQYQKDKEDIALVEAEMKKSQRSISLKDYMK